MITLTSRKKVFTLKTYWFSKNIQLIKGVGFTIYKQCQDNKNYPFFIKKVFNTIHIDLNKNESVLRSDFTKTTQYEIRKAERDGVVCSSNLSVEEFVNFFNIFAQSKNRSKITISDLEIFGENLIITEASHNDTVLVMHCYISDTNGKRIRLLHSASEFRNITNSEQRNLVGRSNRLLHFHDICLAKKLGMSIYDLGGYSISDLDDEKKKINDFKKSFGGTIVEEPDYVSILLNITLFLITKFKKR